MSWKREDLMKLSEAERLEKVKTMKKIDLTPIVSEYLRSKGFGKYICPDNTISLYPEEIEELDLECKL